MDYKRFDSMVDLSDMRTADGNVERQEYEDLPDDIYEVEVEKMELKESKKGDPMFSVMFRILEGDYKGRCLFMNQVVKEKFAVNIVLHFLKATDTVEAKDLVFESFKQFDNLICNCYESMKASGLEYAVQQTTTVRGDNKYHSYEIKEVFEKD